MGTLPHRRRATVEVEAYRKAPGVATEQQKGEAIIYANPLDWWKSNSTDVSLLSALAHLLGNTGAVGTDVLERGTDSHEDVKQTESD